jgi:hypothetical protein
MCELIGQRFYLMYLNSNHLYKPLLNHLTYKLHTSKTYELPEYEQEMRPKHVGAIINANTVQQVGVKYYICNMQYVLLKNRRIVGWTDCW